MKFALPFSFLVMLLFNGCFIFPIFVDDDSDDGAYGYVPKCKEPIYLRYEALRQKPQIKSPQKLKKAGKIYLYKELLFINEPNKGIHVIDNSDKAHPKKLFFIDLPGNIDIAVKDGYLYADSFIDLVVLDVRDKNHIVKVHREEGVFAYDPYQVVEDRSAFYCGANEQEGVVIGYKE